MSQASSSLSTSVTQVVAMNAEDCAISDDDVLVEEHPPVPAEDPGKATKPVKPKPSVGGKPKPKPAKNSMKCPGCSKQLSPEMYPASSRFCFDCTRIKDRLYKAAKRRGESEWISSMMATDSGTRKLMEFYRKQCGSQSGYGPSSTECVARWERSGCHLNVRHIARRQHGQVLVLKPPPHSSKF